jgi:hypothetical protein
MPPENFARGLLCPYPAAASMYTYVQQDRDVSWPLSRSPLGYALPALLASCLWTAPNCPLGSGRKPACVH